MIEDHRELISERKPTKAKKVITLQSVRTVIEDEIGEQIFIFFVHL